MSLKHCEWLDSTIASKSNRYLESPLLYTCNSYFHFTYDLLWLAITHNLLQHIMTLWMPSPMLASFVLSSLLHLYCPRYFILTDSTLVPSESSPLHSTILCSQHCHLICDLCLDSALVAAYLLCSICYAIFSMEWNVTLAFILVLGLLELLEMTC